MLRSFTEAWTFVGVSTRPGVRFAGPVSDVELVYKEGRLRDPYFHQ